MRVRGAVCLITGASSGIGRSAALELARRGGRIVLTGRDEAALRETAERVSGPFVVADLLAPGGPERCAADALAAAGRVDLLVNNAGEGWTAPFAEIDPDRAQAMVQVNLVAPLRLARALLPAMLERGRGWIVNVASIAGHVGVRDEAVYSATKAALIAFGEALRYEVAGRGVGVTTVSPAVVRTAFFERRGRPYERTFPRPISPDRVARAMARGIEHGRAEVFVPRWVGGVARFRGVAPGVFRTLTGRYG